eukprot:gene13484-9647_t
MSSLRRSTQQTTKVGRLRGSASTSGAPTATNGIQDEEGNTPVSSGGLSEEGPSTGSNSVPSGPVLRTLREVWPTSPTTEWQRFSDEELHTHVLRWKSEGSQGLSAASTVDLAIDPHRLARFLETRQSAAGAMFALSTLRGVVDTELDDSIIEKWTSADDEQQQRWTIRLLHIILDPRVCATPSPANKLPRLEASSVPPTLQGSAQMELCIMLHGLITGTLAGEDDMWDLLALSRWRPGRSGHPIQTPAALFMCITTWYRALHRITRVVGQAKVDLIHLAPTQGDAAMGGGTQLSASSFRPTPAKGTSGRATALPPERSVSTGSIPRGRTTGAARDGAPPAPGEGLPPPSVEALSPDECYRCGRMRHRPDACRFREHPFANQNPSIRWVNSAFGQLYRATRPQMMSSQVPGPGLLIRRARLQPNNHRTLVVDALLDSGAGAGDYCNRSVANWLADQGLSMTTPHYLRVSRAWSDSSCPVAGMFGSVTAVIDSTPALSIELKDVSGLDGPFEVILGLHTIRKYDLTRVLRHLFVDDTAVPNVTVHVAALQATPGWLSPLQAGECRAVTDVCRQPSEKHSTYAAN